VAQRPKLRPIRPRVALALYGQLFMVGNTLMIRAEPNGDLLSVVSTLRSMFIGRHVSLVVTPFTPPPKEKP
jgi:hypothetical protein